jgi:cellulose synthase/poly-beta-1,6-N-acetylglucosamine synthase-like glycosyltransferase
MTPLSPPRPAGAESFDDPIPGVSFVIPVRNGARWLEAVIASVLAQVFHGPLEVIAVEDGSKDESAAILQRHADAGHLIVVPGPGRGAAAALNVGITAASHPLIAQVDQDVVLESGWLARLADALEHEASVGAAQGHYDPVPDAGLWSRVMALDLTQRYGQLTGGRTDHVCTGNSVYRKAAVIEVGGFDETLGYGYDNDMSYRLVQAGYQLAFCPDARSVHHWREGPIDYMRQQYGFGYGRLDLVAKHRHRVAGDSVSRLPMMLHAPLMALALLAALLAAGLTMGGGSGTMPALAALVLVAVLAGERLVAGIRAAIRFRDWSGLWFVPAHLARDLAWVAAIVVWGARRVTGFGSRPSDSMRPRDSSRRPA